MRDYGRIYSTFWTSPDIRALSDDGKLLAAYLLTGPHGTIAGVFRLPPGYVADDLGWIPRRVSKGFAELLAKRFVNRCETTNWVVIHKFLDWNRPDNPNQWLATRRVVDAIPHDCTWRAEFITTFHQRLMQGSARKGNGSPTVSKPFRNQEQEQEQDQQQEQDHGHHGEKVRPPTGTETERAHEFTPSSGAIVEALRARSDITPEDLLSAFFRWAKTRPTPFANVDAAFLTFASKHEPNATQRRHAAAVNREHAPRGMRPMSEVIANAPKPST